VDAITSLVEDAAMRKRFSVAASKAAPNLDWNSQVPKLLMLYHRILSGASSVQGVT
jgi:hypothetical protein